MLTSQPIPGWGVRPEGPWPLPLCQGRDGPLCAEGERQAEGQKAARMRAPAQRAHRARPAPFTVPGFDQALKKRKKGEPPETPGKWGGH